MTKFITLLCCVSVCISSYAQVQLDKNEKDTDARSFLSLSVGYNSMNIRSERELFKSPEASAGYSAGINFVVFPDYEFGHFMMRLSLNYQKEESTATEPTDIFQGDPVLSRADFNLIEFQFFSAYRFNPAAKFDFYLGGGVAFQNIINDPDEAYTFIMEDGEAVPIFYPGDFTKVSAFRVEPPKSIIALNAETGFFLPVVEDGNLLNFALGVQYGFFLSSPSNATTFNKSSFYLKLGYELF